MVDYIGNSIPGPGLVTKAPQYVDDELLYSHDHNYVQKGVTLEPGQGVLLLGTILARKTSTKRYVKFVSGGSGGAEVALGILRKTTDTGSSADAQVFLANILYAGLLKLAAVSAANSGTTITGGILGSTVNTVEGFFKF